MQRMRALTLAMGLTTSLIMAQNPIDPYKYLATLEFDGTDFFDSGEQVFPVRFDFNKTQDSNNDGVINPEDNLENIIRFAIGDSLVGTSKTGLSNRGPNDQRPAVYYHYVDIAPWRVHQYWLYYADNDWINNHEHDWEFYFVYTINGVITHVAYSWHGSIIFKTWCSVQKDTYDPSHPRLGVDGGAHAMKNSDEDGVRIRFDGYIERRNGQLNFNSATIPWVIYSNDPNVINAIPYVQEPDTFWFEDPFYGGSEYGDPRLAPWRRTRWTNPEMPSGQPAVPQLPDTIYKCQGDTVILDAGSGGSAYLWSTGETTQTIDVVTPGKYWVDVTSSADGCTYTIPDTVVVLDYPIPDPTTIIANDTLFKCFNEDSVLIMADSGYLFYGWNTGDTGQYVYASTEGYYTVYVIDTFGCWWTDSVIVLQVPYSPSFNTDTVFKCVSDMITISASPIGVLYLWNTGDTTRDITTIQEGTYKVIVVDEFGCEHPDSLTIVNFPIPTVLLGNDSLYICSIGDSAILSADSGFIEYVWNTGDSTPIIVTHSPGVYVVKVVDTLNCAISDTVFVLTYPEPNDIILEQYISKCKDDTITIRAQSGFVDYTWTTGDTTEIIRVVSPGPYYVYIIDSFGCTHYDSIIVSDTVYQHGVLFTSLDSEGRCYTSIKQNIDSVHWIFNSVSLGSHDTVCIQESGTLCVYGFSMCYVDTFCSQVYVLSNDSDTVSSVPITTLDIWESCELTGIFDISGKQVKDINMCVGTPCIFRFNCYNGSNIQTIKALKIIVPQGIIK